MGTENDNLRLENEDLMKELQRVRQDLQTSTERQSSLQSLDSDKGPPTGSRRISNAALLELFDSNHKNGEDRDVAALRKDLEAQVGETQAARAERQQIQRERDGLVVRLNAKEEDLAQATREVELLRTEARRQLDKILSLEGQSKELKDLLEGHRGTNIDLPPQVSIRTGTAGCLAEELFEEDDDSGDDFPDGRAEEVETLHRENAELHREIAKLTGDLAKLSSELCPVANKAEEVRTLHRENAELHQSIDKLNGDLAKLSSELAAQTPQVREAKMLREKNAKLSSELAAQTPQVQEAEMLREQNAKLSGRLEAQGPFIRSLIELLKPVVDAQSHQSDALLGRA